MLFEPENAELLISLADLSLKGIDRMISSMPPGDTLPASEMSAMLRLVSGSLSYGLAVEHSSNGRSEAA